MDRLLTDEDMRNIEAKVFRESQPNGEYFERDVKRTIRDKTAHIVAQEIFKELRERANAPLPERSHGKMSHKDYLNTPVITMADIYDIQSKWGIRDE